MLVFLSHASPDKPLARRLADSLEKRGLKAWLDDHEIRLGQSIPEAIASGIDSADVLCLLISTESNRSKWVSREANAFIMRMLESDGTILPCRLDDARTPALLCDLKYADFRSSYEDGLADLLNAITLKEEIEFREEVDSVASAMADRLNRDELAFFVGYFKRSAHYHVGDRREQRAPFQLLDRLATLRVLTRIGDRYEISWSLNPLGEAVLEKHRTPSVPISSSHARFRRGF